MPWFRVDDALAFNMKAITAGNAAVGLWARAGSWCMQQLTDGFVPATLVPSLGGTPADVDALTSAGLWHLAEGGFQFHDWAEYQPTREQLLAERAAAAERKRKSREARKPSQRESRRDARGTDAVIPRSEPKPAAPPANEPPPFCPKHTPAGPGGKPCRACADARLALEAHRAAAKARPTPTPTRDPECPVHPGYPLPCDRCARDTKES